MTRCGFVDVQVNGFMGIDFSEPGLTIEKVRQVTTDLLSRGTVAYCATVVTSSLETYSQTLPVLAAAMKEPDIAGHILGIHLEGPFLSPKPGARGAHRADCVIPPSVEFFDRLYDLAEGKVSILTLAPEVPGAEDVIRHAAEKGVLVEIGHQYSDEESMKRAVDAGAKSSTHLGNGIPNQIDRHKNPIWWQLACDGLWGTFITDGHHLPPAFIKVAYRAKTLDRFVVISDASALAGLPVGEYDCFGKKVLVEPSGRIYCPESQGLGGSHATMIECMNHLSSLNLLSEDELWTVGLNNPLKLLGLSPDVLSGVKSPGVEFKDGRFSVK
jgi:N-acetylglucosamine-6-phosphate deacetylase